MHIRLRNSAFIFSIIHLISQNDQVGQSGQGGLVWSGLVWSGLVWSGLVWSGLVWSGL